MKNIKKYNSFVNEEHLNDLDVKAIATWQKYDPRYDNYDTTVTIDEPFSITFTSSEEEARFTLILQKYRIPFTETENETVTESKCDDYCDFGCNYISEYLDNNKDINEDKFGEYVIQHNKADRDMGELQDVSKEEIERLGKEYKKNNVVTESTKYSVHNYKHVVDNIVKIIENFFDDKEIYPTEKIEWFSIGKDKEKLSISIEMDEGVERYENEVKTLLSDFTLEDFYIDEREIEIEILYSTL
jgi:hypothetical protein